MGEFVPISLAKTSRSCLGERPLSIRVHTNYSLHGPIVRASNADNAPRLRRQASYGVYRAYGKRLFDLCFVLLTGLPVLLVVAILSLIVMRDGASPFYTQNRVGRGGRVFRMWKLRSMVPNADKVLDAYLATNPEARAEWDRDQKLRHDPRITRFGRLIRATSMDELPQLWNVFTGDMSLVGPRPFMCSQRELYPGKDYYEMRPGITGYWQTSVRNETSFRQRASFDADYNTDLSLGTDLLIVAKTFSVVLKATGV